MQANRSDKKVKRKRKVGEFEFKLKRNSELKGRKSRCNINRTWANVAKSNWKIRSKSQVKPINRII